MNYNKINEISEEMKEFDGVIRLEFTSHREPELHVDLDLFRKLSVGAIIKFQNRADEDYPFEAYFEENGVRTFVLIDEIEKQVLEGLQ